MHSATEVLFKMHEIYNHFLLPAFFFLCSNGLFEKWLGLPLRVGHNRAVPHETFIIVTASVTAPLLDISFFQWKSRGRAMGYE